jgi:hypothetical protein
MKLDILKVQLLESARNVAEHAVVVRAAIEGDAGHASVWRDPIFPPDKHLYLNDDRRYCAWALTEINYHHPDQGLHDTICAPGIVAVSSETIALIREFVDVKNKFKKVGQEARGALQKNKNGPEQALMWLRQSGFPRIHRRQAYCRPRILDEPVERVCWGWYKVKQTRVATLERALHLAARATNNEKYEQYKAKIEAAGDIKFAIVTEQRTPQPRASMRLPLKKDQRAKDFIMSTSPLPMVIDNDRAMPEIHMPPEAREAAAQLRPAEKINPEPWIRDLHLHRYMAHKTGKGKSDGRK